MRLIWPARALLFSLALWSMGCATTTDNQDKPASSPAPPPVAADEPREHVNAPVVRTPMTERPLTQPAPKPAPKAMYQPKASQSASQPSGKSAATARAGKDKPAAAPAKGKTVKKDQTGTPPKNLNLDKARPSQKGLYKVSYQPQAAQTQAKRPQEWKIKVLTKAGKPVTGAKVRLSTANQGSAKSGGTSLEASNLGHGYYRAKGLTFAQAGWWVVTVEVNNQGKGDRAQFNVLLK